MNLLSVVFWTIVSWYNCASMLGRALSCLNMTMALIKWIKLSQSGWHSKPAKGWKDRWVASNSFMRGKKKKEKISGRVLEKNGLLVYCTSTYNNTSYSSYFYWKKDIEIMTTPTLGLTSNAKTLLIPKVQFIWLLWAVCISLKHSTLSCTVAKSMTWHGTAARAQVQERIVDVVVLYKPVGPNTYKVGKVIVSWSVGLQPRQTVPCKYIRYWMLGRC